MSDTTEVVGAVEPIVGGSAAPTVRESSMADVPREWVAAMRLAARIHQTPFVPKVLRGDPASVMACILTGEELGLGPMQSLRMVNVIEGRPAASAELMRALVNRAGHRLSVVEATQDQVTLYGRRRDTGADATVTWTIADAQRAKLTGEPGVGEVPAVDAVGPGHVGVVPADLLRRHRRPVHAGGNRGDRGAGVGTGRRRAGRPGDVADGGPGHRRDHRRRAGRVGGQPADPGRTGRRR